MHATRSDIAAVLGREPRWLDLTSVRRFVKSRRVLVTGAGGSVGAEACRQLHALGCKKLVGIDNSDHALLALMERAAAGKELVEALCDVRDRARLTTVFKRHRPHAVIHAAAQKQVYIGDRHPNENVLTNLIGVRNAFEAALESGAEAFVFVSSDKAAAPTNVMGVCKRLAEFYLEGRRRELAKKGSPMRIVTVRFGNVFGSKGSVAKVFERQIADGGPLTVTDRDMRRYFMTNEEAVQLALLVTAQKLEGEKGGGSYLLDMGQPVRIVDIARRMMAAAGVELDIVFTGAREGEKLEEELYDEYERVSHAGVDGVLRVDPECGCRPISPEEVAELERIARLASESVVRERVFAALRQCFGADVAAAIQA